MYAKRFRIGGFTRDKEYPLTRGAKGTRIFHFSVHETEENSSQISVNVYLKAVLKLRNLVRPFHFADLRIKNRGVQGNIITKHPVERVSRIMPPAKTGDEETEEETPSPSAATEQAENTSVPDTETPQAGTSPGPEEPPAGPALEQGSRFDS